MARVRDSRGPLRNDVLSYSHPSQEFSLLIFSPARFCASIWRLFSLIIMILSTSDTISSLPVGSGHSPLMKTLACWRVGLLKTTRKLRWKLLCRRSVRCTSSRPLMQMDWEWNTTGTLRGLVQGKAYKFQIPSMRILLCPMVFWRRLRQEIFRE